MDNEAKPEQTGNKNTIIAIIIVLIVGAAGFFAGIKYQQSKTFSRFSDTIRGERGQFMPRFGNQNGNGGNFQPLNGEIISSDGNSITVKLPDGSSKIVFLSVGTNGLS